MIAAALRIEDDAALSAAEKFLMPRRAKLHSFRRSGKVCHDACYQGTRRYRLAAHLILFIFFLLAIDAHISIDNFYISKMLFLFPAHRPPTFSILTTSRVLNAEGRA